MSFADGVRLYQELLEVRADVEDPRWEMVNNILYQGGLERSKLRFIERYLNNVLIVHFHGTLVYIDGVKRLVDFCATLEHGLDDRTAQPVLGFYRMPSGDGGDNRVQMSMLVDVREYAQHPEKLMPVVHSVIRLQSLNECECSIGYASRDNGFSERRSRDGRSPVGIAGGIEAQGKHKFFSRAIGNWSAPIPLDKIEKDVVERRPELIDDFASEYGNFDRRLLGDLQFWCALRLGDYGVRISATVFGNGILDRLVLFHCSKDFGVR